jgi:hypothetical protein
MSFMTDSPISNSPIADTPIDSRLTVRVLKVWKKLSGDGLPRRSQIDPKQFEPDWSNCFMIDLDPELSKSRFSYVGNSLSTLAPAKGERQFLSECPEGTLRSLLAPHIQRVVEKREPTSSAGSAQHGGSVILYRTALLPLSEIGYQVDGILAAFIYREVSVQNEFPIAEITPEYGRPKLSVVR